jgi:hypothetical protein
MDAYPNHKRRLLDGYGIDRCFLHHALDTLTGWTMDRYIGPSISLWRPE